MIDGSLRRQPQPSERVRAHYLALTGSVVFGVLYLASGRGALAGHGLRIVSLVGALLSALFWIALAVDDWAARREAGQPPAVDSGAHGIHAGGPTAPSAGPIPAAAQTPGRLARRQAPKRPQTVRGLGLAPDPDFWRTDLRDWVYDRTLPGQPRRRERLP